MADYTRIEDETYYSVYHSELSYQCAVSISKSIAEAKAKAMAERMPRFVIRRSFRDYNRNMQSRGMVVYSYSN